MGPYFGGFNRSIGSNKDNLTYRHAVVLKSLYFLTIFALGRDEAARRLEDAFWADEDVAAQFQGDLRL